MYYSKIAIGSSNLASWKHCSTSEDFRFSGLQCKTKYQKPPPNVGGWTFQRGPHKNRIGPQLRKGIVMKKKSVLHRVTFAFFQAFLLFLPFFQVEKLNTFSFWLQISYK